MAMDGNPAQRERAALAHHEMGGEITCGPVAAECGCIGADLGEEITERRPDAAIGIVMSKAAGYTDKVQSGVAAGEWDDLVDTVRSGPPIWSPTKIGAVDKATNTIEFFVHLEDVRRAGDDWEPRELDADLTETLYSMLSKMAKRLVKSSSVGIVLAPDDGRATIVAKQAEPSVTVSGSVGELVLFVYGRQAHSRVEVTGDD
ncbi:MAG: TIGR03085 family protein, partial [Acidimicrobiales bacterium]